jgi:H+/gluconate symporter-like permease
MFIDLLFRETINRARLNEDQLVGILREILYGVLIVVATAGLGGYYAWRQWQALRRLRADAALDDEEHAFQRNQAWRRLTGAVLLLLIAAVFVGVLLFEVPAARLVRVGEINVEQQEQRQFNEPEKEFVRLWGGSVIVLLLLILGLIGIAGYEMFAIRRYSLHHMRRIQDERRAMIARETARLRRERNGHP